MLVQQDRVHFGIGFSKTRWCREVNTREGLLLQDGWGVGKVSQIGCVGAGKVRGRRD